MTGFMGKVEATEHRWTDEEVTIRVRGLSKATRVLHLTDTHVTRSAPQDEPFHKYGERMDAAYAKSRHHRTGLEISPVRCFEEAMVYAMKCAPDLIALTGDIINNPSATSVQAVKSALDATGIDYLYIPGNHDWHYEGMEGSSDELRARWRTERLLPLYRSKEAKANPGFHVVQRGGIRFVTLDNSTYQIDEEQLEFFRQEIGRGQPTVLLIHIPLSTESLPSILCGHPDWGAEMDKNYIIERRRRWPETGNTDTTKDFVRAVAEAPTLVAILTGHIHVAHAAQIAPRLFAGMVHPSAIQYVTRAGAIAGKRLFHFLPSE